MRRSLDLTRRTFLHMAWGTVPLLVTPVSALARLGDFQPGTSGEGWSGPPGKARYRIEGLAKVLGEKIFARDYRARDVPGWPKTERMAMALRVTHADRPFLDYDLSSLPPELRPLEVVDAGRLAKDHIQNIFPDTSPSGKPPGIMAVKGEVPVYLGQPAALLIFADAAAYGAAYRLLQFQPGVIEYGEPVEVPPVTTPYPPPTFLTRYAASDPKDAFSQVHDGKTNPNAKPPSPRDLEARAVRARIREEVAQSGWQTFSGSYTTQVLDPMFMEPEAGLAWLDGSDLRLVLGTQSPNGDIGDGLTLFNAESCPINVSAVHLLSCYPGGGFGGRDVSPFSPLIMLAAAYSDGPVRMANDRFEQFQAGLKQLGSVIDQTLAIDAEGTFQATEAVQRLPAGGKNNYSQYIAELAGYTAGGGYRWPRVIVDAFAQPTIGVVAGSMRGFGGPQAAFALETLVDETAVATGRDPIELRRQNVLRKGDRTITGAPLRETMGIVEMLDCAAKNPIWTERRRMKDSYGSNGTLYGVGVALANQAYGTGTDGVMADVGLAEDGSILVQTNAVDMGNGAATTLAITPARYLGANAGEIRMGVVEIFDALDLSTSTDAGSGHRTRQHPWLDPHYTASFSMSSSACITAFQQVHAVGQASLVLFRTGVWPAACGIWGLDLTTSSEQARWVDGALTFPGRSPLGLAEIAAAAYGSGVVVAAMVHALFQGRWISASYQVGEVEGHWHIDGLSTRAAGSDAYVNHLRFNTVPPLPNAYLYGRSLYAPSLTLAAVEVDRGSGQVSVVDLYTYLNAGTVHQPDLVSGQYQGAAAMGVGYALLEEIPIGPAGGGDGSWNLDRYHVALAGDLPLDRLRLELLPAKEGAPGRGIAEAVLCPIAPAIANAVSDATGRRFRDLPITPAKVRAALTS